jgi:hypothetical protein
MTISCDGKFQKIRTTVYAGFENVVVPNRSVARAEPRGAEKGKGWRPVVG